MCRIFTNPSRKTAKNYSVITNRKKLVARIVLEITALNPATCCKFSEECSKPFKYAKPMPLLRCYICLQGSHDCLELAERFVCSHNCLALWGFVTAADLPSTCCQLRNVLLKPPLQNLKLNWKSISWNRVIRTLTRTKIRYSNLMQQNTLIVILIQERYHRRTPSRGI